MESRKYKINIEEIWCIYATEKTSRIKILTNDIEYTVENYVKKIYEEEKFIVLQGSDVHLFLWFCCGKFDNKTGQNWGGEKFTSLNIANEAICTNGMISKQYKTLVNNADEMWFAYHQTYPPKKNLKISDSVRCFDEKELINLLQIYSSRNYDPRGAPDLFVYNPETRDKQFIEVKSYRDSLRYEQLQLASAIVNCVGNYFTIAYVLPLNHDELQRKGISEAILNLGAKHLKKLVSMDINKLWSTYSKSEDKKSFATNRCGVNPNCLSFFLFKTKNLLPEYHSNYLDFQGKLVNIDKYLGRLEVEWNELHKNKKQ